MVESSVKKNQQEEVTNQLLEMKLGLQALKDEFLT